MNDAKINRQIWIANFWAKLKWINATNRFNCLTPSISISANSKISQVIINK